MNFINMYVHIIKSQCLDYGIYIIITVKGTMIICMSIFVHFTELHLIVFILPSPPVLLSPHQHHCDHHQHKYQQTQGDAHWSRHGNC